MLGITWRDRKRATWIREQTEVEDILTTFKKKKWSWAGHVMRRTNIRWKKNVTEWEPRNYKRSQDRQKIRWRRNSGSHRCVVEYTSIRQRKVEVVGKSICPF